MFLINHKDEPEAVTVQLNTGKEGDYALKELLTNTAGGGHTLDGVLKIGWDIPRKDVRIISIETAKI